MKILIVNTFYFPIVKGGVENTVKLLVDGLLRKGHSVRVISFLDPSVDVGSRQESINQIFKLPNLYVPNLQNKNNGLFAKLTWHSLDTYNFFSAGLLQRSIQDFNPDVISLHNLSGWSVAVWDVIDKMGIPFVQVLHDYYLACINSQRVRNDEPCLATCTQCKAFRFLHKKMSGKVPAVIGISEYILDYFKIHDYFPNAKAYQIYNTIHKPLASASIISNNAIGYIGTIAPHKGIHIFLQALTRSNLNVNTEILIAGEGESGYISYLKKLSCNLPFKITFLGKQKPSAFFPIIDCLVVPSLSDEPLGRVVFEAHSYGVPTIASNRGGIPEMILSDMNGYLFEAGNVDNLAKLLNSDSIKSLTLNKESIIDSSSKFVDVDNFVSNYCKVYEYLVDL